MLATWNIPFTLAMLLNFTSHSLSQTSYVQYTFGEEVPVLLFELQIQVKPSICLTASIIPDH